LLKSLLLNDLDAMRVALSAARKAGSRGEVPVGAVLICDGQRFSAYNLKESRNDPTAHAEMLALQKAARKLSQWRLGGTLYVTLEPCAMCAGAILEARVNRLVFGALDPKAGACGSVHNVIGDRKIRHTIEVIGGVSADLSSALLKDFFKTRRRVGPNR
jgi:tRNA(adenine34) deaminase